MRWTAWSAGAFLILVMWTVGVYGTVVPQDLPPERSFAATPSSQVPERPSAAAGEPVYLQSCAPCHGPQGEGQGPAATGLASEPTAFAEPNTLRVLSPRQIFEVIRRGRTERGMPPWANRLSEEATWSLVAYLLDLNVSPEEYQTGRVIYRQYCAGCHGPRGKGDGPEAEGLEVPDLTRWPNWVDVSNAEWVGRLLEEPIHFPVATDLSRPELTQAVAYARTLSYSSTRAPLTGSGVILGDVTMMTEGEQADFTGLTVTLLGFRGSMQPQLVMTTTVTPSHTFRFEGLSTEADVLYSVSTTWEGAPYSSGVVMFPPDQKTITVTLAVAATTEEDPGLRADQVYWFIDLKGDQVVMGELINLTNPGDRAYIGPQIAAQEGKRAAFRWPLPLGATQVSVEGGQLGERFLLINGELIDTMPITPGVDARRLLFRYTLPVQDREVRIDHPIPLPVRFLNVLIADRGQRVEVPAFMIKGQVQNVGNVPFQSYMTSNIPPGTVLTIVLRDIPSQATKVPSVQRPVERTTRLIGIVLAGALGMSLLASVLYFGRRRSSARAWASLQSRRDALLREVAALDEQFEAGKIEAARYRAERDIRMTEAVRLTRLLEGKSAETHPPGGGH